MFRIVLLVLLFVAQPASSTVTLPGGILPQLTNAPSCGYQQLGRLVNVSSSIQVCLPPVLCNPETCPPYLGKCVSGQCQYIGDYKGLATIPTAIATYYCELAAGGCNGALGGSVFDMAKNAAASLKLELCGTSGVANNCVGIAATSPMLMGNSQIAHVDASTFVPLWGLGLTYASGVCYELTGPNGKVTVAMTDRCAGYCRCDGSNGTTQAAYHECGEQSCFDSPTLFPNEPCVGTLPQIGYNTCGGFGCAQPIQKCDWCASNSHPHFDLDQNAFNRLCGTAGSSGHCKISGVIPIACDVGIPAPSPNGGGSNGGAAPANSFNCNGVPPAPEQPLIPGTNYCCYWGMYPNSAGACGSTIDGNVTTAATTASTSTTSSRTTTTTTASASTSTTTGSVPANSFNCNGIPPAPEQPLIPGTNFCCFWGLFPNSAGSCGSATVTTSTSTTTKSTTVGPAPANSFNCNGVSPAPQQPRIPGTSFCCYWGLNPNSAGSCS